MSKIDLKTEYKSLYSAPVKDFALVEVPSLQYLMFDGQGDPNTVADYPQAIEALYSLSYTLKFMSKRAFDRDYVVGPLEGLWWAKDMTSFAARQKDKWSWTMMILQPDWIEKPHLCAALSEVVMKKGLPGLEKVRLERLEEGLCAQILHIGPFDDEGPTLERLHTEWLPAHGLIETGKHHEIYLSDARKVAPDKLRTILRQPVRPMNTAG
ncbi:GyrI-like domain-containing protein [Asticcacaulis sp. 201]|uniref:GyrI-like domain-containing protein n=1 Tax=Asticcacaulis sp. 201 TaxID=3028787 RepID=UPI0029170F26|nr:GyrI-like domain-containing protein [Asticcacaulis sp. 201]MDV6333008.1 GyrI-like domain-containing protein [Asticcacaulis sp. 201]